MVRIFFQLTKIIHTFVIFLGYHGALYSVCVFAHACAFDRNLMMSRILMNENKTRGYAILPWLPFFTPITEGDRALAERNAAVLSSVYTMKRPFPVDDDNLFSIMNHCHFRRLRCYITRNGLECFLGFRLEF